MASSSSSVPTGGRKYDVFLSFRGEDTRFGFVDNLHAGLLRSKLLVFIDDKLPKGKDISAELFEAIKGSACVVVVLSKNYADSSWCLRELAKIMECRNQRRQLVIPVFYHVDPSDVRKLKGDFKTAFREHEEKYWEEIDEVNKWKEALTAVGNLGGEHTSKELKKRESVIINGIVQNILDHVRPRAIENNLFGMESHIDKLRSLLDLEATEEVRTVGILGMGGIGKTTIARALFGRISDQFEGCSFLLNVREESGRHICALQVKILQDITNHKFSIKDKWEGVEIIKQRIQKQKVLLVFDDVADLDQFEFLPARHEWFSAGSRIIITTRWEHVLAATNGLIYKPRCLPKKQAVELFSWHAFEKKSPPEGYKELSDRAIRYTGCLPLALKVIGSSFRNKEASEWESALDGLAEEPERKITDNMKISFNGLSDYEKNIFLDIACFFKGDDEAYVIEILDSFGFHPKKGIKVLKEKCLITISNGEICMHDVLQDMGLEIARKSYPNSRLRQHQEILDFIEKNKDCPWNLKAVEAIMTLHVRDEKTSDDNLLIWSDIENKADEDMPDADISDEDISDKDMPDENMKFNANVFENMKNIRLLDIRRYFTSDEPTTLPHELRSLRWYQYPFSSLPVANGSKLVGLHLSFGKIQHLWTGYKVMQNLKSITLQWLSHIERFPDVSGAPNLEKVTLFVCPNLMEVHESLGTRKKLVYLEICACRKLEYLPPMKKMPLLETLNLSHCHSLQDFQVISSSLEKLSSINLNGTYIQKIPSSICELRSLKSLHLHDCYVLEEFPENLCSLQNLEELRLGATGNIKTIPLKPNSIIFTTLREFSSLKILDLGWRSIEDQQFLDNLHELSSLEELHLSGNSKLVQLPASISRLSKLKHLELNDCPKLQNIGGLPSEIQVLKAYDCIGLEQIEDLTEEYARLRNIFLPGCERLLDNHNYDRYLNKMLEQSFVEKCASIDQELSICIPGNEIPSWIEEQRHGNQIALKSKCLTDVMGFVVCGVLQGKWPRGKVDHDRAIDIHFKVGTLIPETEADHINAFAAAEDEGVWIFYIPFCFFQKQMYDDFEQEDWYRFVKGNLIISMLDAFDAYGKIVRCGVHLVYRRDVKSITQMNTCTRYQNWVFFRESGHSFKYIEKVRKIEYRRILLEY